MEITWQLFADFLSLLTIGMCFILKVPQILNLFALKSAKGMSLLGLCLELISFIKAFLKKYVIKVWIISYTLMTSYNFTNGYSLLSYLEYPIILVQEYILILLVLKYLNRVNSQTILISALYFITFSSFLLQIVPKPVLTILAPICTPISASSKIVQLVAILRAKNSESISTLTWLISTLTNLTRVFTIWMDSADILLLGNFIISTSLSASIMFFGIYYKWHPKKE
ncbi:solute carrier family 66 member 3 isoform X3 [Belonocnema kinseyi]|nr:solute carrier family 66 member 3 isoform X3 [Belonocnema kinseyi]XP_033223893.1 solute carrier family 66 member 3 isoform X3 [Belonocnema kinseyi]XP_033223894.1 solute carrier family 66 member 3 isoform X3 [Belonocnema kinseyi]XP_033223895.1 solute carrier family 66 member 3 isoform X3 [Belonocnema kinseyi]